MNFKLSKEQYFVRQMVKAFENENIAEKIVKESNEHGSTKSKEEKEAKSKATTKGHKRTMGFD